MIFMDKTKFAIQKCQFAIKRCLNIKMQKIKINAERKHMIRY